MSFVTTRPELLALAAGLWTSVVMHDGTPNVRRTGEILTAGAQI